MSRNGARHSPYADIQQIRTTFTHAGVDAYFLLKELLQNADDSGAKHFAFGEHPGLAQAEHPLLRIPALFAHNDDHFREQDAQAIRSLGESAKSGEAGTVGKFGLGLKSAFALCELFFFQPALASALKREGDQAGAGVLNLWSTDAPDFPARTDWDDLPFTVEDQQHMRQALAAYGLEDGFTLWFPLRRREHCWRAGHLDPIEHRYFEEVSSSSLLSADLLERVAHLLPLLGSLEQVTLCHQGGAGIAHLSSSARRRSLVGRVKSAALRVDAVNAATLQGEVWTPRGTLHYSGLEQTLGALEVHKDDPEWPTTSVPDGGSRRRAAPEKADPHAAVLFTGLVAAQPSAARLEVRWSVFLPIPEAPQGLGGGEFRWSGALDYQLTLHGCFFVAPDRRSLVRWSKTSGQDTPVRQRWNAQLAHQGTLALVVPALSRFGQDLPEAEQGALTQALERTDLYRNARSSLCIRLQWTQRVELHAVTWQTLPSAARLLPLYIQMDTPDLFPSWSRVLESYIVVPHGQPRLTAQDPAPWTPAELGALLEGVLLEEVFTKGQLPLLVRTLELLVTSLNSAALRPLLRDLPRLSDSDLRDLAPSLGVLLDPFKVHLSLAAGLPRPVLNRLAQLDLEVLLLPSALGLPSRGELSASDAATLMAALERQPSSNVAGLLETLVKQVPVDAHPELFERISQLALFPVNALEAEDTRWVSLSEARTLPLYGVAGMGGRARDWLSALVRAVSHFTPLLSSTRLVELFGVRLRRVDLTEVYQRLEDPQYPLRPDREALFELLLNEKRSPERDRALRYLLSGRPISAQESLYTVRGASGLLERFARALFVLRGEAHTLIEGRFAKKLNEEQRDALVVQALPGTELEQKASSYIQELSAHLKPYSAQERFELARTLPPSLARRLPLFITEARTYTSLARERVYLEGGVSLPPEVQASVTLVLEQEFSSEDWQRLVLNRLDPAQALNLVLETDSPHLYLSWMLQTLKGHEPGPALRSALSSRPWLPTLSGDAFAPEQVVHLPELREDLERLLDEQDPEVGYTDLGRLKLTYEQRQQVLGLDLLPARADMLEVLALLLLGAGPRYHVGTLNDSALEPGECYNRWRSALHPDGQLPASMLLDKLGTEALEVFEHLRKPLPLAALSQVLVHLAQLKPRPSSATFALHRAYLRDAVQTSGWQLGPEVSLLSQGGQWQPANTLCVEAEGVDSNALLHREHREILESQLASSDAHPREGVSGPTLDAGSALESYFSLWRDGVGVPGEPIGAFLSLLGNDSAVRELARRHLGQRSFELLRDLLKELDLSQERVSPDTLLSRSSFTIEFGTQSHVGVNNLLGERIQVQRVQRPASLLEGSLSSPKMRGGQYHNTLRFAPLTLEDYSPRELLELLAQTTRLILSKHYLQTDLSGFDEVWQSLADSAQFELASVQNIIIEDSVAYASQLKLPAEVKGIFDVWNEARRQEQEYKSLGHPPTFHSNSRQTIQGQMQKVRELLEQPSALTQQLFEGVRQRVSQAGYEAERVPFELFQNADDALVELVWLRGVPPDVCTFVVEVEDSEVRFLHWGRAVNQYALGTRSAESFKGDLQKMLVLYASDKGEDQKGLPQVTGKFGLGFKSVFLACDQPQVVSGQLSFEVSGGIYPRALASEPSRKLRARLEHRHPGRSGTVLALPGGAEHLSLEPFKMAAPLLPAFSHQIKALEVEGEVYRWEEQALGEGLALGRLSHARPGLSRALLLRTPSGTLLMRLGSRGVESLESDVPTLWVTTPVHALEGLGFAVGAPFEVHVSRTQLAPSEHNRERAEHMGQEWGQAFGALARLSADWESLSHTLELTPRTTRYTFWNSVFERLAQPELNPNHSASHAVIHTALWTEGRGLRVVLEGHPTLPNGLPAGFERLLRLTEVRFVLAGPLAEQPALLESMVTISEREGHLWTAVVHPSVLDRLEALGVRLEQPIEPLGLSRWLAEKVRWMPHIAPDEVSAWVWLTDEVLSTATPVELQSVKEVLSRILWLNEAGEYVAAHTLLSARPEPTRNEESLRAAFAPPQYRLHGQYDPRGVALFKRSRPALSPPDARVVAWVLEATDGVRQRAVLDYLLHAAQADALIEQIEDFGWLAALAECEAFQELSLRDQRFLSARLGLNEAYFPEEKTLETDLQHSLLPQWVGISAKDVLERLYNAWHQQKSERLDHYEQSTYPEFFRYGPALNWDLESGSNRLQWLTLLLLGTYHRMGRTRPEQHRAFLELAEAKGWLEVWADPEFNADRWVDILDAFLEDDRQLFDKWINFFLPTYQLSRHLGPYITAIEQTWKVEGVFRYGDILESRSSQQAAVSAPSLKRTLSLGSHFVLRELVRRGVVKNPLVYGECYLPSGRVRAQLSRLGCAVDAEKWAPEDSRTIYAFLCSHLGEARATFDGAFDLPFALLGEAT